MCPSALYTTHTVRFSPHISNRFTIATTVISETARYRSRLKVVGINPFFALSSYPTENTVSQLQRPIITGYYHQRTLVFIKPVWYFRLVLTNFGKFSVNVHKKARPSGKQTSIPFKPINLLHEATTNTAVITAYYSNYQSAA
jgi:hypothetical protein